MTEQIHLGFTVPEGHRYTFQMHHIVVTGMTQISGKSTTVETILKRKKGKSLVFLTKRGEKTFQDAHKITPFYKERFDWEYVRSLLAATWHEKMKFETAWIIRIAKHTKSLVEFRKALTFELEHKKLRDFDRNVYLVLAAYLDKVLPVLEKAKEKFTDCLELKPGINVMDLTEWYTHEEVQMLIIRACMEWILEKESDVTIGLPEAWKLLPQSRNTPVKLCFEKFIREGATNRNYLIIDAQDLGGVDKTPLRQVNVWIMGRMKEANEVARLLKQTLGLKMKPEVIQKLPLGHFVVAEEEVETVYVWANGVPEDVARKVARGELTPEYVRDKYLKRKKEDEDLVYKEKWEEEKRKREKIEADLKERKQKIIELIDEKVQLEQRVKNIGEGNKVLVDEVERFGFEVKDLRRFKEIGESADELRKAFTKFLRLDVTGVKTVSREIGLQHSVTVVEVEDVKQTAVIKTDTVAGKILTVAKKGKLNTWRKLGEVVNAITEESWTVTSQMVNNALNDLVKQQIIAKKHTDRNYFKIAKNVTFK